MGTIHALNQTLPNKFVSTYGYISKSPSECVRKFFSIAMQGALIITVRVLILAVFFCFSTAAYAEIHGTITGTTNYIWRMYSKSNNGPAIQANLDYQHPSGFYTGTSASSFNFGLSDEDLPGIPPRQFLDPAHVEITPYIGWSFKLADDWRLDTQYSRYFYDGHIYGLLADYNEFYLFLHYKDLLTFQASYIDKYYGLKGDSFFCELTGRYPLTDYLEVSSALGYGNVKALQAEYFYWNAGLTGRYKFIALDLRYFDAHEKYDDVVSGVVISPNHPHTIKATVAFSISVGF